MRRFLLTATPLALTAALWLLWNHRYESVPGLTVWRLADLRAQCPELPGVQWRGPADRPLLRLTRQPHAPPVALRLALPGAVAVDAMHLRHRVAARDLIPGDADWETGRVLLEWYPVDSPDALELDPVAGAKLNETGNESGVVALPARGPAVPALRLEHIGRSGDFEVGAVEITAVRERALWKYGRWLLASAWFTWCVAMLRSAPATPYWRAAAASAIWLAMGIHFVIPGPWKTQRPLGGHFQLGTPAAPALQTQAPPLVRDVAPAALRSEAVPASGRIEPAGGLALRVKHHLTALRPLLHALLICAPTLAFLLLLPRRAALGLAASVVLAMELSQVALGYGFGWDDILDLATDAAGIALAVWLHHKARGR